MGVYAYVGCPLSGKTYLAVQHARARGRFIALDFMYAKSFLAWTPRVETWQDALAAVFRGHSPVWSPEEPYGEVTELCIQLKTLHAGISLLVDEAYNIWRPGWTLKKFGGHVRATQHHGGNVYYTTQRYGDLGGDALTCTTGYYVFRSTYPPDLDRLKTELALDPETLRALPEHHSIYVKGGFQ